MLNRRDFLKNSGALALGGLALPTLANAFFEEKPKMHAVGVQLYTATSVIDKDLNGTLAQIAKIGYKEIESAYSIKGGFYGLKPKEFAALLKNMGLSWQSHHATGAPFKMPASMSPADSIRRAQMPKFIMKNLRENYQEIVDSVAEGGVPYLVCSSTPLKTMDEINASIDVLGKTGEACKKAGVQFAFHNHTAEFEKVDGQLPFEIMISQLSSDILKFELDLAWATKAGVNIPELFAKNPGRFPLFHVKDLNKEQRPVEVGEGYIDFKPIFANAKVAGMKHIFVEQDQAPSPIDNLTKSFGNLKKILV